MTTDQRLDRLIELLESLAASRGGLPGDEDGGPSLRLAECGDLLTAAEYSRWARQELQTTYNQVSRGKCLVAPFKLKPPQWRRVDCEAMLERRDVAAHQRKARMVKRLALTKKDSG